MRWLQPSRERNVPTSRSVELKRARARFFRMMWIYLKNPESSALLYSVSRRRPKILRRVSECADNCFAFLFYFCAYFNNCKLHIKTRNRDPFHEKQAQQ